MRSPAIFVDRDGTLMEDAGYVSDPAHVQLYPGTVEALRSLRGRGFKVVIVTNQSGIGRGYFAEEAYHAVQERLLELIGGSLIDATYFCADHPEQVSTRRKPAPGMLLEAAEEMNLDLERSWMVGDRSADLEAGLAAGVRPILVLTGIGAGADASKAVFVAKDFASAAEFILKTTDA